jgi:hypothetical protein
MRAIKLVPCERQVAVHARERRRGTQPSRHTHPAVLQYDMMDKGILLQSAGFPPFCIPGNVLEQVRCGAGYAP